jgi:hypothetical protein
VATSRLALALSLVAASLLVGGHGRADGVRPTAAARALDGASGSTVVFPYRQRRLLYSRNAPGGLAYVTSGAAHGASLPVVVFLHGMNPDELMHPWFGPPYGDLRPVLESLIASGKVAPLVRAAPTHTRFATGATSMWPRFDLDDFLDATEAALGESAKLDRARVVVVGHSGAGCNAAGGILAESVRRAKPLALVDVDGCVDETIMPSLAQTSASTPVHFFWQRTWVRPIPELESACPACKVEEITDLAARPAPHVAILPEALRRVLPELLPRDPR